jgi:hypothetical protein
MTIIGSLRVERKSTVFEPIKPVEPKIKEVFIVI